MYGHKVLRRGLLENLYKCDISKVYPIGTGSVLKLSLIHI